MLKDIHKYISEGRSIIYISTLVAFLLRLGSFFQIDSYSPDILNDGFLWLIISPYFSNTYISHISAFLCSIGISLFFSYIIEKYAIIRIRTSLPYSFSVFLLACFPPLAIMSPVYIGVFCVLQSVNILYSAYQQEQVAAQAFRIGFTLAIGSLFTPNILFYIIIFFFGFFIVRSFNYKVILATLLGSFMVYWLLVFSLLYWNGLSNPLTEWFNGWVNFQLPDFTKEHIGTWIYFVLNILIVITIIFYNYINSFKDKVQVRAYLSFYNVLLLSSAVIVALLLLSMGINFGVLLIMSSFIYSHYFALSHNPKSIYLFFGLTCYYFAWYLSQLKLI